MKEPQETDFCYACRWQGSWDGAVCPECGASTVPIEWSRCLFKYPNGPGEARIEVVTSDCKCGEHGPGTYFMPTEKLVELGIKAGDEFLIVANLDGVQGQVLTLEQGKARGAP